MYLISKKLIDLLEEKNVKYCHWKSNLLLNEALAGYDDLDLLVSRDDIFKFEQILLELNFKEASNGKISLNSIKHFYGLDEDTGEILHLHVYYQIKTGPSWIKSYRFDFEEYYLDNLIKHESGMKIPEKHIEFVIFIFRVMLKYTKINEFLLVRKENKRNKKEIEFLLQDIDRNKLDDFLSIYFKEISSDELFKCIEVIKNGSSLNKYFMALKIKRKLSKYNRFTSFQELYKNFFQLIYRVFNKFVLKEKKSLHNGGLLITIVGLDATGKSTVTNDLRVWLKRNFTTSLIHFGKPKSSLFTYPLNFIIKIMRKKLKNSSLKSSKKTTSKPKSLLYIIRQVILAYDRYNLIKKYWKKTSNGEIIICDRYKSENFEVMDSKRLLPEVYSGIKQKLALFENNLYNNLPKPDILIQLVVPVEVAVVRNNERVKLDKEDEDFLRQRYKDNDGLNYDAKFQLVINTDDDYDEIIKTIKKEIWNQI